MRLACLCLLICMMAVPMPAQSERRQQSIEKARQALAAGRHKEAVRELRRAKGRTADERVDHLLAVAHSKIGVEQERKGDLRGALRSFQAANRAKPGEVNLLLSLGHLQIRLGAHKTAERRLREALAVSPEHPQALAYLGQIEANRDRLGSAGEYFRRADRAAPGKQGYDKLADRFQGQSEVERDFDERRVGAFIIQHPRSKQANELLPYLEGWLKEVQRDLRSALGRLPADPVRVVLYGEKQFKSVSHAQHWADAYYDGKIRLNLDSSQALRSSMRQTLRHEVTHAFLHELYGELPLWVHEGFAQLQEGKPPGSAGSQFRNGEQFLGGELFENGFASSDDMKVVAKGYAQALMAVGSLARGRNSARFRALLVDLSEGASSENAMRKRYGFGMERMLELAKSQK